MAVEQFLKKQDFGLGNLQQLPVHYFSGCKKNCRRDRHQGQEERGTTKPVREDQGKSVLALCLSQIERG